MSRWILPKVARAYLGHFPVEKGKWRVWSRLYPKLRTAGFDAGFCDLKHGVRMYLEPGQFLDQHCYYWRTWEPDETRVVLRFLRPGDSFVDVGANAGYFSLLASSEVGPKGHVWAFEPVPPTVEKLRRNLEASSVHNVTVVADAASRSQGRVSIARQESAVSVLNSMRPSSGSVGGWNVNTVRIDDIIPSTESIRMIKLDAEGAELLALQGAETHLRKDQAPLLLCEVTDSFLRELGGSAEELWLYLKGLGYRHAFDCHGGRLKEVAPDVLWTTRQINVLLTKNKLSDY